MLHMVVNGMNKVLYGNKISQKRKNKYVLTSILASSQILDVTGDLTVFRIANDVKQRDH